MPVSTPKSSPTCGLDLEVDRSLYSVAIIRFQFTPGGPTVAEISKPKHTCNPTEAAEAIGMTTQRVYDILKLPRREGGMDGWRPNGRCWLIPRSEVQRMRAVRHRTGRPRGSKTKKKV